MPVIGDTIAKHPAAKLLYSIDWTAELAAMGVAIATSAWAIIGPDGALTYTNATVLPGNLMTQLLLIGGTDGQRYRVENTITVTGTPQQIDPRSFFVQVKAR